MGESLCVCVSCWKLACIMLVCVYLSDLPDLIFKFILSYQATKVSDFMYWLISQYFICFFVDNSAQKVQSLGPNLQEIIICGKKKKKELVEMSYEAGNQYFEFFFGCFFSGDSLLKETCSSLHFTRGEVLLSDPHHRCWRWKSPLCEVWENCVCVSSTRLKARILRYLTHRRLHPQTEMLQSGLQARGVGVCVFVCLRRRGFKGVTRR